MTPSPLESLVLLLRALKMPTIARHAAEVAQKAEREGWSFNAVPAPPRRARGQGAAP